MNFSARMPIGRIAVEHPATMHVFERYHLDYCCHGERPLEEACADLGLGVEEVVDEIARKLAEESDSTSDVDWREATSADLITHIVEAYHQPLRQELPRLIALARKVTAVHGSRNPSLSEISDFIVVLRADLLRHMAEEEEIFFPRILQGELGNERESIAGLEHDHAEAGAALEQIRGLTEDYSLPPEACGSWRALWSGLEELEQMMHEHVHLENNVLFPREKVR